MRNEKFRFITESMASHRIDETNSEYSESIVSNPLPRRKNRFSGSKDREMVVEEVDDDESEESKNGINRRKHTYEFEEKRLADDLHPDQINLTSMRMQKLRLESEAVDVNIDTEESD